MTQKYWAIRMKGWVEIRRAAKKPTAFKTSVYLPAVRRVYEVDIDHPYGHIVMKTYQKQFTVITFKGGSLIGSMTAGMFAVMTGKTLLNNKCCEIAATKFHELKEKLQ